MFGCVISMGSKRYRDSGIPIRSSKKLTNHLGIMVIKWMYIYNTFVLIVERRFYYFNILTGISEKNSNSSKIEFLRTNSSLKIDAFP
jgi:hypothetical protein